MYADPWRTSGDSKIPRSIQYQRGAERRAIRAHARQDLTHKATSPSTTTADYADNQRGHRRIQNMPRGGGAWRARGSRVYNRIPGVSGGSPSGAQGQRSCSWKLFVHFHTKRGQKLRIYVKTRPRADRFAQPRPKAGAAPPTHTHTLNSPLSVCRPNTVSSSNHP